MAKNFVIDKTKNYAVLTGDIVGSSKLSPADREKLPSIIKAASKEIRSLFTDAIPYNIDVFRGDSWQVLVTEPQLALRVALFIRAFLKSRMGLDTKVFIGIGKIESVSDKRVSLGNGPAYIISGRGLENLKDYKMGIDIPREDDRKETLNLIVQLIDYIISGWTVKQAYAVSGALKGWTQQKIGENWIDGIVTQQMVQKHLISSAWAAVETALVIFEKVKI